MKPFLTEVLKDLDIEYGDIRIEESEVTTVLFRGKELDECRQGFERGGTLRLFKNGNWVTASFNTIDEGLRDLAKKKAKELELLPKKRRSLFLLPPLDFRTDEEKINSVALEEKVELTKRYNQILLSFPKVVSTLTGYGDSAKRTFFYSTEGRYIEQKRNYFRLFLSAIAKDGTNIQDYANSFASRQTFKVLLGKEEEAERIAQMASDLLAAEKVTAGTYTVVIDPKLAGVFAHEAFGHLSEADFLYTNQRLQEKMRIGTTYGVSELSIVDDPTLQGEWGGYQFDDEGVGARRNYLIKEGKIFSHLHSKETAKAMSEEVTGNARTIDYRFSPIVRMSNTFIEPRDKKLEEMISEIEDGLYVAGTRGGMTELEFFTFSSQYAYRIRKGEKRGLVRDVIIQGNVFETLKNIEAIGCDLKFSPGGCGKGAQSPLPVATGGPHIRIRNCLIGGK